MEKRIRYIGFILIVMVLFNCGSSSKAVSEIDIETMQNLFEKKALEFKAESALPLLTSDVMRVNNALLSGRGDSPSRIMLDDGYFLKIKQDSSSANLPYYGEVRMADYSYGNNSSIQFKGSIDELNISNHKSKKLIVKYKIQAKEDTYNVLLEIFPSKSSNLTINSSLRNQIKYRGNVVFDDTIKLN